MLYQLSYASPVAARLAARHRETFPEPRRNAQTHCNSARYYGTEVKISTRD